MPGCSPRNQRIAQLRAWLAQLDEMLECKTFTDEELDRLIVAGPA
jgi:hypothetical protein